MMKSRCMVCVAYKLFMLYYAAFFAFAHQALGKQLQLLETFPKTQILFLITRLLSLHHAEINVQLVYN